MRRLGCDCICVNEVKCFLQFEQKRMADGEIHPENWRQRLGEHEYMTKASSKNEKPLSS